MLNSNAYMLKKERENAAHESGAYLHTRNLTQTRVGRKLLEKKIRRHATHRWNGVETPPHPSSSDIKSPVFQAFVSCQLNDRFLLFKAHLK